MADSAVDRAASDLAGIAQGLAGRAVRQVVRVGGGGNSRIYRVACADGTVFALKNYPPPDDDPRDRLAVEVGALGFLARHGVGPVPAVVASDRNRHCVLLEWIDGEPVAAPDPADIDTAIGFIAAIWGLNDAEGAADQPLAAEACLSLGEILGQIGRRRAALEAGAGAPELAAFLGDEFAPALEAAAARARAGYGEAGIDPDGALDAARRCLIPADFGFHNALRRRDGSLAFVDFEYFGWDDPVKLVADFLLHPAMALDFAAKSRFYRGLSAERRCDASFAPRFHLLYPLFGLRWCLILLNEFLPAREARRRFAGEQADAASIRARQLARARRLLGEIAANGREYLDEP